ncbi:MAG: hypothetical protein QXR31_03400 [Zestosphaera sp.]
MTRSQVLPHEEEFITIGTEEHQCGLLTSLLRDRGPHHFLAKCF